MEQRRSVGAGILAEWLGHVREQGRISGRESDGMSTQKKGNKRKGKKEPQRSGTQSITSRKSRSKSCVLSAFLLAPRY